MKKKYIILLFFSSLFFLYGFHNSKQYDNLYYTCKIWGLVKYYHPSIASGNYNLDTELFKILNDLDKAKTTNDVDAIFLNWIDNFGVIEKKNKVIIKDSNGYKQIPNYSWLNDKWMNNSLKDKLESIIKSYRPSQYSYYVSFSNGAINPEFPNEKIINEFDYTNSNHKLLYLFKFWNVIEYYFPYKYLMDKNWDDILKIYIPKFINANSKTEVHEILAMLVSEINDSHCYIRGSGRMCYDKIYRKYDLPVKLFLIDNKVVVTEFLDKYKETDCGLRIGDVILSIDGVKIKDKIEQKQNYVSLSNFESNNRLFSFLLNSDDPVMNISCERDGKIIEVKATGFENVSLFSLPRHKYRILNNNIAYILPDEITRNDIPSIMDKIKNTKGLVIDMRGYPKDFLTYELGNYLLPNPIEFVMFTKTTTQYPGLFERELPTKVGCNNPNYYKGAIVIIVNSNTISNAEFTVMAWSKAPKSITIGSQTSGADGNVSSIVMPDGLNISFSGIGVYYPDGGETQRVGVRIDEIVKPTIRRIREGRDELLERAIELIEITKLK